MNPASLPLSPDAEEQASLWAARLDGSALADDDREALSAWLALHPGHRALLSAYCQFSADLEQQLPLLAGIRDEVAEIPTATNAARLSSRSRRPLWVGAALLAAAAAVAVILLRPAPPSDARQNIATPVGQRQELTLADGSHVELNAHTTLVAELNAHERRVRLAGGEAFFHVTKDPSRPFYVETPAGSVRVTGTQFNVRTESAAGLEVTVLEGSVQVRPGDEATPRALRAGDQLTRADGQVAVQPLAPAALDQALAWRRGQVVFNDTPLREALARFARYHGRDLTASDAAARLHVGGVRSLDDLDGFLSDLEQTQPVRAHRGADGSIRVMLASD